MASCTVRSAAAASLAFNSAISAWTSIFSGALNSPLDWFGTAALNEPTALPSPSRALVISLGTTHTLFASPWAMAGNICMYW